MQSVAVAGAEQPGGGALPGTGLGAGVKGAAGTWAVEEHFAKVVGHEGCMEAEVAVFGNN